MYVCMYVCMYVYVGLCSRPMYVYLCRPTCLRTYTHVYGWMNGRNDGCDDGWMGGPMDGCVGAWMGGGGCT